MNWRLFALAGGLLFGLVATNWLFVGWRPRLGLDAYFQDVIGQADVAERFAGSAGRQDADVTEMVCDRVDADVLNGLGFALDDRTTWPRSLGGGAKPMDIWKMYEDKGWIPACNEGIRHLKIEINRETATCQAKVRLWHLGCYP